MDPEFVPAVPALGLLEELLEWLEGLVDMARIGF